MVAPAFHGLQEGHDACSGERPRAMLTVRDSALCADPEHPVRAKRWAAPPRIVVAEDDAALRALVVGALVRDGYDVVEAASGADAVAVIETLTLTEWSNRAVDLVLTDVRMAGCTGLRLAQLIRRSGWPIPVILMTAFPDDEVRTE